MQLFNNHAVAGVEGGDDVIKALSRHTLFHDKIIFQVVFLQIFEVFKVFFRASIWKGKIKEKIQLKAEGQVTISSPLSTLAAV